MHFLYPTFMWALIALGVPVLVHLFNFRKAKLIKFSDIKFLESVQRKNSSRKRLKQLIILTSRLLFLLFMILAFAQPYIPGQENGLSANRVTIYLDNSQSMSNPTLDGNASLAAALNIADELLDMYPDHTKARLLTNDFSPSSNNFRNKSNVKKELLALDYSGAVRNGNSIMSRLHNNAIGQDVIFISDFQASTFGNTQIRKDSLNKYHVIPIPQDTDRNIGVDSIYLKRPFVTKGQNNQIIVRIKNFADQAREGVVVKLYLNEKQYASISVDINPQSFAEVAFEIGKELRKINKGRISFEDYPMVFDNEYYFTLKTAPAINIVEVKEKSGLTPFQTLFSENDQFQFHSYTKGGINYEILGQVNLLILNELNEIDNGLKTQIDELLRSGKSVIVIPGRDSNNNSYSQAFQFRISKYSSIDTLKFDISDPKHPFFTNIFEEVQENSATPRSVFSWQWEIIDDVLLKSQTDKAFLSKVPSKGNLFLFAGSIQTPNSNFARNALIVPIMYRIAEMSSASNQRLAFSLNESVISLQLDSVRTDYLYKLKKINDELVPAQRTLSNQLILDLPNDLMQAGHYDLTQNEDLATVIAFNHSKKESDLAKMSQMEVENIFAKVPNTEIHKLTEIGAVANAMKERYDKIELWKYALILSLIFLLAEALLIRFL